MEATLTVSKSTRRPPRLFPVNNSATTHAAARRGCLFRKPDTTSGASPTATRLGRVPTNPRAVSAAR